MDEHLEELIKLAWKASPSEAEYYLFKHIMKVHARVNEIEGYMEYYDNDDAEHASHYNNLLSWKESLEKKLNKLKFILSFLRGS